jgi:CHAT domain-containing protein/Tfp pilus assembly protein PilF
MQALSRLLLFSLLLPTVGSVERVLPNNASRPSRVAVEPPAPQASYWSVLLEGQALAGQGRCREAASRFEAGYREAQEARDDLAAARLLANLANARLCLYEYRQAMEAYLEGRRLAASSGDRDLAETLPVNIAWLYRVQGALAEAETELRRALSGPQPGSSPQALLLLAELRFEQGALGEAVELLKQALGRAEQSGNSNLSTHLLERFGDMLLRAGDLEGAEQALLGAYRRRVLSVEPVPALCYRILAELRLAQGDLGSAQRLISRAFEAARSGPALAPLWSLSYTRARIRKAQGELERALADLEEAIDSISSLRLAYLPAESVRAGANAGLREVYDLAVEVSADLYRQRRSPQIARLAFELAERSRAIALREALDEFERIRPHLPPEYFETLQELSLAETEAFRRGGVEVRERIGRLRLTLAEHEAAAAAGAAGRMSPAALRYAQPVTAAAVQQVLAPSEALLSFHLGARNAYLWALSRRSFEMHSLGPSARLASLVAEFRRALADPAGAEAGSLGAELERLLFAGLGDEIRRKPDWLLLVDRALFELPFAALAAPGPDGAPRYLIERHSLRLVPSAAMLLAGRGETWRGPLVAIGDPIYNRADPRWKGRPSGFLQLASAGRRAETGAAELARLVGSGREIASVAASYRGGSPEPILLAGPQASRQALHQALSLQPAVLHFATHVVASPEDPSVGMIALSLRPDGTPEMIGMPEIASLEARPALVVMSGCRSGGGALLPGEGLWGLTRAWLRAGAQSVAATLWPVTDHSGELLQRFYSHLDAPGPAGLRARPERAMQRAQIEMIRSKDWRARPGHWAAFFVMSRN